MPNPQPTQQTNQMGHADAKASMGIATFLQSHLIPKKPADQNKETAQNAQSPEPPTNQQTGTDMQAEMQGLESRIFDELGTLKQEIQKAQPQDANKELQDLKQQLQAVIDGND